MGVRCLRGVRLGEASNLGPPCRRVRESAEEVLDSLEREFLRDVAGGSQALPFVRLFYGQPSQYLWADDMAQCITWTRAKEVNRVMH